MPRRASTGRRDPRSSPSIASDRLRHAALAALLACILSAVARPGPAAAVAGETDGIPGQAADGEGMSAAKPGLRCPALRMRRLPGEALPIARSAPRAAVSAIRAGGAPGMILAIDPETGGFVPPTAEQRRQLGLESPLGVSAVGPLVTEILPDGSRRVDLRGRFLENVVMRVDAAGRRRFDCVRDGELERVLGAAPAVRPGAAAE